MNFAKELKSAGVPCSCNRCGFVNCKNKNKDCLCDSFFPTDIKNFIIQVADYLEMHVVKSKNKRLIRKPCKDNRYGIVYDENDTLDRYYVAMINDTLTQIRQGHTAYLFHLFQIQEIMRFEDIDITYNAVGGNFAVRLRK